MHRKVAVSTLVYNYLYPRPTPNDPPNFSAHLNRYLVPEIRVETARFYGSLNTIEARYPGLNYTYPPHIRRLSSFPHHQRLFRALARLHITNTEVLDLARWEGTLWARERFEKDEGYKVLDTTGDEVGPWVDRRKEVRPTTVVAAKSTTDTTARRFHVLPVGQMATACDTDCREPDGPVDTDSEADRDEEVEGHALILTSEREPVLSTTSPILTSEPEMMSEPDAILGAHPTPAVTHSMDLLTPPHSPSGHSTSAAMARIRQQAALADRVFAAADAVMGPYSELGLTAT